MQNTQVSEIQDIRFKSTWLISLSIFDAGICVTFGVVQPYCRKGHSTSAFLHRGESAWRVPANRAHALPLNPFKPAYEAVIVSHVTINISFKLLVILSCH